MNFCHLHAHSTYSILDAWGRPADIVERLKVTGLKAHALTDHDSMSGHWKFQSEMVEAGLKPLFGVELRVVDDLEQRHWKSDEGRRFYPYHLGLIASTQDGYRSLLRLLSLAWKQGMGGRGKFMPVATWDDIERHQAGLIGLSGCLSGKISRAILGQIDEPWQQVLEMIESRFESDSFFLEWQNIGLEAVAEVAQVLAPLKRTVVTHDVHFPDASKRDAQNIMAAIMRWKKVVGADGQGPMHADCYLASAQEVEEIFDRNGFGFAQSHLLRAMDQTAEIAERCNVELVPAEMVRFPIEGDKITHFKELINLGWRKRGLHLLPKSERKDYLARARYEFDIIEAKDYVDYFLIIADICQFCVRTDILKGPARGSSAGSLIAWCLEITEVDPLKHGLIFERFVDLNRHDLPDIDMDFPDNRREEIHEYLAEKYGRLKVGYVGTFTTFKAKNSLEDIARVFELPRWVAEKIKPYIPWRDHGDARSKMTLIDVFDTFDEAKEIADKFPDVLKSIQLEGQFRGMGVHPAGFVVSSVEIEDYVPIYEQPDKGRVIGLDLYDAAEAGFLKIDLLGLKTMTAIAHARDAIRKRHNVDVDFYSMPLDDEETMRGFTNGEVLGIFQFGGRMAKSISQEIKPTLFRELVDINTLARPGPILSGTATLYVAIHQGRSEPVSIHPIMDEITADTHNLVLYQEQVLRIMREFGGLDWQTSSEVRKMMSKSMGVEILQQFRDQFIAGAATQGIDEEIAQEVWSMTSTFGAYGFNKSHAVSYSLIAWWQMWVKQHYPTEFYFAQLSVERDSDKRDLFIQEAWRKGVEFLPVHPNHSEFTFSLEPEGIRYGLTQIHGIGEKTASLLIEARPFTSWDDVKKVRGVGTKTIEVFKAAYRAGEDLFGLGKKAKLLAELRTTTQAISIPSLLKLTGQTPINTQQELIIAGHIISRNYRQEQKLATQMKSGYQSNSVKSYDATIYIRDESGESFPIFVPGWLVKRKAREIWEGELQDIYSVRGKLAKHGRAFLANGLANTDYQKRQNDDGTKKAKQLANHNV